MLVYNVCMRVNISLPEELLKNVDKYCKKGNFARSELIRKLLRDELWKNEREKRGENK